MSRVLGMQKELEQIGTIRGLTSIFEAIASIHIAQIKDKVVSSTKFFDELWGIYAQLRRGEVARIGARPGVKPGSTALVAVTSEGGLIGDIDERIVRAMSKDERMQSADIFVIGGHGVQLLAQRNIRPAKSFELPDVEKNVDVSQIAEAVSHYENASVYYQTYISLTRQEVAQIDLFTAVAALGKGTDNASEVISERDYIFEPSIEHVLRYMESVMLEIALGQVVLESKLAQYASRFNTMSAAKSKAKEMAEDLRMDVQRAKRSIGDERTKEIMSAMKLRHRGEH